MTLFAYLALVSPSEEERAKATAIIDKFGCIPQVVHLAQEHGATELYGLNIAPDRLYEIELEAKDPKVHLEGILLDPEDPAAKLQHYQHCARLLKRNVVDFHDDEAVDELFGRMSIDLPLFTLLGALASSVSTRPIIFNLDPDFELRFGKPIELSGLDEIKSIVWSLTHFRDVEIPLRLIIAD